MYTLIVNYSKQAIKFLSKQNKPTKIRIINAISALPEEAPDAIDLAMLDEIKNNPDCREFVSEEEAMKLLGL